MTKKNRRKHRKKSHTMATSRAMTNMEDHGGNVATTNAASTAKTSAFFLSDTKSSTTMFRLLMDGDWIDDRDIGNLLRTSKSINRSVDDEDIFRIIATRHRPFANNRYQVKNKQCEQIKALSLYFPGLDWNWRLRGKDREVLVPRHQLLQLFERLCVSTENQIKFQRAIMVNCRMGPERIAALRKVYPYDGFNDEAAKNNSWPVDVSKYNNSWKSLVKDGNNKNGCVKVKTARPVFTSRIDPTMNPTRFACHALLWDRSCSSEQQILLLVEAPWKSDDPGKFHHLHDQSTVILEFQIPSRPVTLNLNKTTPSKKLMKRLDLHEIPRAHFLLHASMNGFWTNWEPFIWAVQHLVGHTRQLSTASLYFDVMFRVAAESTDPTIKDRVLDAYFASSEYPQSMISDLKVLPPDVLEE
jgi:hypothetical protein